MLLIIKIKQCLQRLEKSKNPQIKLNDKKIKQWTINYVVVENKKKNKIIAMTDTSHQVVPQIIFIFFSKAKSIKTGGKQCSALWAKSYVCTLLGSLYKERNKIEITSSLIFKQNWKIKTNFDNKRV